MRIITNLGQFNTEKHATVLLFNNDAELSELISKLISIEPNSNGIRVLTIIPKGEKLNALQTSILEVINMFDGLHNGNSDRILSNSINGLNDIKK